MPEYAAAWEASDGTRWVQTPGKDEWTGWVPGEDGCWLYTGDEFRRSYPEAPMTEPKIATVEAMHEMSVDEVRAHLRRYVADLPPDERSEVGVLAGNSYVMLIAGRIEFLTGAHKAAVLADALRAPDA